MSLVNMKEMLCEARKAKKAVGAFNITNYETAAAVLKAAEVQRYLACWKLLLCGCPVCEG